MDLEKQKENLKNHVAKFTDYGNIKILDFKDPNSSNYRIRFLFEEDYCRLHISGDLGELIATNYNNMTYERFSDFVHNTGYFKEKINCHSRAIYRYEEDLARKELLQKIKDWELEKEIVDRDGSMCENAEEVKEAIEDFIDNVLEDYSDESGIGSKGYDIGSEIIEDFWEIAGDLGKEDTGILDLYMLAFELAKEQLKMLN